MNGAGNDQEKCVLFFMSFFRGVCQKWSFKLMKLPFICGLTRRGYEFGTTAARVFGRTEISLDVPASLRGDSKQNGGFLASRSPVGNLKHPAVSVRKLEPMRFTISRSFVCSRDRQFRLADGMVRNKRLTKPLSVLPSEAVQEKRSRRVPL